MVSHHHFWPQNSAAACSSRCWRPLSVGRAETIFGTSENQFTALPPLTHSPLSSLPVIHPAERGGSWAIFCRQRGRLSKAKRYCNSEEKHCTRGCEHVEHLWYPHKALHSHLRCYAHQIMSKKIKNKSHPILTMGVRPPGSLASGRCPLIKIVGPPSLPHRSLPFIQKDTRKIHQQFAFTGSVAMSVELIPWVANHDSLRCYD